MFEANKVANKKIIFKIKFITFTFLLRILQILPFKTRKKEFSAHPVKGPS